MNDARYIGLHVRQAICSLPIYGRLSELRADRGVTGNSGTTEIGSGLIW